MVKVLGKSNATPRPILQAETCQIFSWAKNLQDRPSVVIMKKDYAEFVFIFVLANKYHLDPQEQTGDREEC